MGDIATRLRTMLTNELRLHSRTSMESRPSFAHRPSVDQRPSIDQRPSLDRITTTASGATLLSSSACTAASTLTPSTGSVPAASPTRCEGVAPAGPSPFVVWEEQEGPAGAALPPRLAADPAMAAALLAWGYGGGASQPRSQEGARVVAGGAPSLAQHEALRRIEEEEQQQQGGGPPLQQQAPLLWGGMLARALSLGGTDTSTGGVMQTATEELEAAGRVTVAHQNDSQVCGLAAVGHWCSAFCTWGRWGRLEGAAFAPAQTPRQPPPLPATVLPPPRARQRPACQPSPSHPHLSTHPLTSAAGAPLRLLPFCQR